MRLDLRGTPSQHAEAMHKRGCVVVFTAAPALSGRYAMDWATLADLGVLARDAAAGLGLPAGATTVAWEDWAGHSHLFTAAQIQALYRALRDQAARLRAIATGQAPSLPPQPITIP